MRRFIISGLLLAYVAVALVLASAPAGAERHDAATKPETAARHGCGEFQSSSIYPKAKVVVLRGAKCEVARSVAIAYDHSGAQKAPWQCALAHGGGRALFSCGYPSKAGDIRERAHALVAYGVGSPSRP